MNPQELQRCYSVVDPNIWPLVAQTEDFHRQNSENNHSAVPCEDNHECVSRWNGYKYSWRRRVSGRRVYSAVSGTLVRCSETELMLHEVNYEKMTSDTFHLSLFYMGWHHRLALSYQLSFLHLLFTLCFSLTFISAVSTLCGHSFVGVCDYLWHLCGQEGEERWMDRKRERERGTGRPDDLIFSQRLSKPSTVTSECVRLRGSYEWFGAF